MRVWLPVLGAAERAKLRSVPPPRSDRPARSGCGQVLVVDDQEPIRLVLGEMLEWLGYRVVGVASGSAALEALSGEAEGTCCILLDRTIPGEDAAATVARFRERLPGVPVVFMSGYEATSVSPSEGFLHKPFHMDELRAVLGKVLG